MSNSMQDDIAYLRGLAESGRNRPILGGAAQAAAGLVYAGACFVQWAVIVGKVPVADGRSTSNLIWLVASALVAVVTAIFYSGARRKLGTHGGAPTTSFGMAWAACGFGIVVAIADLGFTAYKLHQPAIIFAIAPVAFAFYGAAWWVAGAATKRRWMFLASAVSFAVSLTLAIMPVGVDTLLVIAAALFLTLALPGLKLMADETR
jgi:hypothetical protein